MTAKFIAVGFDFATILLNPVFCLFLHPLRHRFGAVSHGSKLEFLAQQQRAEMADVKQMKMIVPLIACEITLCCQYVTLEVWCQIILDVTFRIQINLSNNQ